MNAPKAPTPRDLRLAAASDPTHAAAERGPLARLHWRHGLDVDPDLAGVVVDTPDTPGEWAPILAETHAALLDPTGLVPLARPSPIASKVVDALQASDAWPTLADAAQAHPMIAREAVRDLATVVLDALKSAGAKATTDARKSMADLDAARAALERARAAQRTATTPDEKRAALKASIDAGAAVERASADVKVAEGIATRAADAIEPGDVAEIAERCAERARARYAVVAALGTGTGVGGDMPVSDEILRLITPEMAAMLRNVGALRATIREGRASRHVSGREGMIGQTQGGLARVGDLTSTTLAALAGHLGPDAEALATLALVEDRADVVEKGGGTAHKGDVVVVLDKSGSMRGAREQWAAALALAVILEARHENRRAAIVTYDGRVRGSVIVDSAATFAATLRLIAAGSGGANNEHAAMVEAGKVLAAMPHGGDPADVLMITDGEWYAANLDGVHGVDRARLRGAFIGGSPPPGAAFASAWEVRAVAGKEGTDVAVEIARSIV